MVSQELPAYQRLVDGQVLPAAVGNHPALDFCNTRAGWGEAEPSEYLESYDHVVLLAREAGLATGVERGDETLLTRAIELRDAIYRACTDPQDREAVERVAAEARTATQHAVLVRGEGWRVREHAERPLLELARSAAELLASDALEHVGRCPGHGCGWLFLDPRGRRRWCVMEVCGNRAKARRFAARKARR